MVLANPGARRANIGFNQVIIRLLGWWYSHIGFTSHVCCHPGWVVLCCVVRRALSGTALVCHVIRYGNSVN